MGPPGGTITSIAVCPSDSKIVLAGTNGAGILRSTDGGESWSFSSEGVMNPWISGVRFSRSDPSVVYLATNYGVCKSTNAGASWVTFAPPPLDQYTLLGLDVSPSDSNVVYAVVYNSVLKTTDGGITWQAANSGLPASPTVVFVDRSDPNTVFAATYSGVFKSTNGGGSWGYSNSGLAYPTNTLISCFDSSADGGYLYAGSARQGLFKSTDRGANWVPLSTAMTNTFVSALAVDQQSGAVYAASYAAGISTSTDNGRTWTVSNQGLTSLGFIGLAVDPVHPATLYTSTWGELFKSTDQAVSWTNLSSRFMAHAVTDIVVESRTALTRIYAGTSGGVYKTTDHGQTWANTSQGLGNLRVTSLRPGSSGETLYAATEGGFYRTTDGGTIWVGRNNGLTSTFIYSIATLPGAPETIYAGTQNGLFKTTNAGDNWARSGTQLAGVIVYAITRHPQQPDLFYAATYQYPAGYALQKSTDGGLTWAIVNLPVSQPNIYSIRVDPSRADTVYVLASGAGVLRSTDAGTTWEAANPGQLFVYSSLAVDPRNPAVLYLGSWGRVYKSEDRGKHWLPIGAQFADSLVTTIAPYGEKEICVGTTSGVFGSDSSQKFTALFPFCHHSGQELTGFAVSNSRDQTASLEVRLFGADGQLVATPVNPAPASLPEKQQVALLADQIFGFPATAEVSGWAELTSSIPVSGFFQVVGQGLDGGIAFTKSLKEFYFTRILDGPDAFLNKPATVSLQICNPGSDAVTAELQLLSLSGSEVARTSLDIPAHGFRKGTLREVFVVPSDFRVGFIAGKVVKGEGVIGFASIRLGAEGTLIGLNVAEASTGQALFSGQMAAGPGVFSSFRLVNTSLAVRHVTLYAIDEAGQQLVAPVGLDMQPLSAYEADAAGLFGFSGSSLVVGSLRVESDAPGVIGDVVFGEPDKLVLAAALPLQDELFTKVVFSQVANGMGLFTGLAFYVPGSEPATVTILVYSAEGVKTGETELVMPGGSRKSRLLTEFIPGTAGQIRGFVLIRSTQPLVAQELFAGADSMSAVPGVQVIE